MYENIVTFISFFPSEQLAGFNPSSFGMGGAQPSPMFPEEGPGSEGQQAFMGPQKEIASFYQVPEERGMMESSQVREFFKLHWPETAADVLTDFFTICFHTRTPVHHAAWPCCLKEVFSSE